MKRVLVRLALRSYPPEWRRRFGAEVTQLVEDLESSGSARWWAEAAGLAGRGLSQRWAAAPGRSRWAIALGACVLAFGTVVVLTAVQPGGQGEHSLATMGTIPSPLNGRIDLAAVPDFVAVAGPDGYLAGYARRSAIFPGASAPITGAPPGGGVVTVYASDLRTVVGHVYPGDGFVVVGTDPSSAHCTPMTVTARGAHGSETRRIPCPSDYVVVPHVLGDYAPTALGRLSSVGLSPQPLPTFSNQVRASDVIAVSPPPGSLVPARTVVTVTYSLGPDH